MLISNSFTSNVFVWTIPTNDAGNTFKANVIITDSASTPAIVNSIYSSTVTITSSYTPPSTPTLSISNTVNLNTWQYQIFSASISGGTPPYTYNFQVFNSITNTLIANQLGPSNTFQWHIPSAAVGNSVSANVFVTDAHPTTLNSIKTPSFTISNILITPSVPTISNKTIDVGQISVANAIISGGAGGPYSGVWAWYGSNQLNNNIVNTIIVGSNPQGVAFDPTGSFAYVVNENSGTVNVIDGATNTVTHTITVGASPYYVAFEPYKNIAYVINSGAASISVINTATNSVINTLTVGLSNPQGIAFNPTGTLAYIVNTGAGNVVIINTTTNVLLAGGISVGSSPKGIAINPFGNLAYVTNEGGTTVSVINTSTATVVNTITVGSNPWSVAFSPSGYIAYVTNLGSGTVSVINVATNTVINTISLGGTSPEGVIFDPTGSFAYVIGDGGIASVINVAANSVVNSITLGSFPNFGAISQKLDILIETNGGSGTVNVIAIPDSVQNSLSTIQTSNGLLQLTINAISSTSVSFRFNGITYTQTPLNSKTIYGTYTLYGSANEIVQFTSPISNTLTINPALTVPTLSVSNTPTVTAGGIEVFTANGFAGGSGPYTYNFQVVNSVDGTLLANMLITNAITSNSFTWSVPSADAGNTFKANVIITDSATTPVIVNSIYSATVTITSAYTPPTTPTLTLSNTLIDQGQSILFTANGFSGGTGPYSYNYQIVNSITGATIANRLYNSNSFTSNTFLWTPPNALYFANTFKANVIVTDAHPTSVNSIYSPIGYNSLPTLTASPSNILLDSGQTESFTLSEAGGTGPLFNTELYNGTSSTNQGSNVLITSVGGSNTISFMVHSPTSGNVFSYSGNSYDRAPPLRLSSLHHQ